MNIAKQIEEKTAQAFERVGIPRDYPPMVHPASRPEFGDYQADGIMNAAKKLRTNPRELATKVLATLDLSDLAEDVNIAGPGFLNIVIKDSLLIELAQKAVQSDHLNIESSGIPETVVVDYSGPNLAKEMHVGHLRSTIIGDALARIFEFRGHNVIRQNHVGDFGTQFGMLIAHMAEAKDRQEETVSIRLADLEEFYREAKKRSDNDHAFRDAAREYVVRLQQGDEHCEKKWNEYVRVSMRHCQEVYERLSLSLTEDHIRAESSYRHDFANIMRELADRGLLTKSDGAQCVFLEEFKGREDSPLPFIVQKSDGAYLYSTFDLAALKHRSAKLHANRILYVHDSRQGLHFRQAFAVARAANLVSCDISLEHIAFGTMLGKDGKPFKTREGGTVKLMDLLNEAENRAYEMVTDKNPDLPERQRREIACVVGIGAVKYADISMNRTTDYVFSWDKMLSFNGNTAPYMQYAYSRIMSIFRKTDEDATQLSNGITPKHPTERALLLKTLQLDEVLDAVCSTCCPHLLCNWLYDVTGAFMKFYESCPVLKADPETKQSRLGLCNLTATALKQGLALLGIQTIDSM